jgi:hypothetical protein
MSTEHSSNDTDRAKRRSRRWAFRIAPSSSMNPTWTGPNWSSDRWSGKQATCFNHDTNPPPPYNNLFYMSSLGWGIGQIVSMLRSFFLTSICIHIRIDVVCVGKFPLLSVWKELLFTCRQIHTIYTSQICFSEQVLP